MKVAYVREVNRENPAGRPRVRITVYFEDRERAGPYRVSVPARRTKHIRFNELTEPDRHNASNH